jgi:NAD(P)-dependent dehydrogenase (short-subunit alcohol dehydrogenase family)
MDEVRAMFDINLFGAMAMVQAFVSLLIESGDGCIVNIGVSSLNFGLSQRWTIDRKHIGDYTTGLWGSICRCQGWTPCIRKHVKSRAGPIQVCCTPIHEDHRSSLTCFEVSKLLRFVIAQSLNPHNWSYIAYKQRQIVSGGVKSNIASPQHIRRLPPNSMYQPMVDDFVNKRSGRSQRMSVYPIDFRLTSTSRRCNSNGCICSVCGGSHTQGASEGNGIPVG